MKRIFFYCARQAYKGIGDNEEMYKILELPDKNASQEVVNEALRIAMSTRKEDTAKFEKLQLAEGVLGDPRKRRLYDDVGYAGYLFLMSGSAQFDVVTFATKSRHRCVTIYPIVLFTWALVIETILVSMKCDGRLEKSATWMQIWTPIWFVDLAVLILAAFSFADFKNKNGESIELKDTPVLNKIYDEVLLVLIVLVQLFLFLKVDNLINWNWFAVFSPWIAREVLMATKAAIGAFTAVPKPEAIITTSIAGDVPTAFEEKEAEKKRDIVLIRYLMKRASKVEALHNSIGHLLRVWLAIFLSLKLNNQNNWNWGLVLLPIWVHFAFNCAFVAYVFCGPVFLRYLSPYALILMSMTTLCIWIPAFLARRLEGFQITTFVILLQFMMLSIYICCYGFRACLVISGGALQDAAVSEEENEIETDKKDLEAETESATAIVPDIEANMPDIDESVTDTKKPVLATFDSSKIDDIPNPPMCI